LHIFEPRYRQMTRDALADDQLLAMVQIPPAPEGSRWTEPVPIRDIGCLGRIVQHERLGGGRFNLLLLGGHRVRLKKEKPTYKLYRIAEAEIIAEVEPEEPVSREGNELIELFRSVFEKYQRNNPDLAKLLEHAPPLGVLTDIIAAALPISADAKQRLLAEPRVIRRVEMLRGILVEIVEREQSTPEFPPPFSDN
jgi:Lon protease-like protein